jgi:carbamate kinase
MTRVVVALGGNALLRKGEDDTIDEMRLQARAAAEKVADIAAAGWEVVVTHGNGPQVGRILLQQEAARGWVNPMPLDVCGAESQGQIGYLLQVAIGDVFFERGMERPVATVLTLTRVRPDDPAFREPTKPVGPYYQENEAKRLADDRGFTMAPDAHGGWRRVVPSPSPYSIVEGPVIEQLVADGVIVIAAGGGGAPVTEVGPRLIGVEGVVDKDLAAAILARDVGAKVLLMLTDVPGAFRGYSTPSSQLLGKVSADAAREMLDAGEFGSGSMGPKVQAALDFLGSGGERALIGALEDGPAVLAGEAGTAITRETVG